MTMFVHHAIVHCGEDRCHHGDLSDGTKSGHCPFLFTEWTPYFYCRLFNRGLNELPGTGVPGRCFECRVAEEKYEVE